MSPLPLRAVTREGLEKLADVPKPSTVASVPLPARVAMEKSSAVGSALALRWQAAAQAQRSTEE